ncbi:DUF1963 domain-containing protein [Oceanobacillus kapialis]|uniref:DUF1963 domain-containing protein n=1 Tax=Oceanobacillus kapialis TaxID=481353 RepID=UPI00384E77E3
MDFENLTNQENFKVIYHEQLNKDASAIVQDFSFLKGLDTTYFPIEVEELALSFKSEIEPVSINNFRNGELLGESVDLFAETDDGTELLEVYSDTFLGDVS